MRPGRYKQRFLAVTAVLLFLALAGGYALFHRAVRTLPRNARLVQWLKDPTAYPEWIVEAGSRCENAPFQFPTRGYIGYLWDDQFQLMHRHQGIDIFGGTERGQTPVYAAYSGYLTRLPEWKSSLIIRIPTDPLQPGHQIWIYYTHLADPEGNSLISDRFPPGTSEVPVSAGELLGTQGDFSGDPKNPVGVHLHFSIVRDNGQGKFLNELEIGNTLDPSPYFGRPLNADRGNPASAGCQGHTENSAHP